jgi:hypothetical protein
MTCPACTQRKARRSCPALGQTICSVCCATKRLVEINCPADCVHLVAARDHPAAAVKRQQEHDVARLLPTISHLTERQHQLFFLFHTLISQHVPEGFARLNDEDVAEAAAAVAATLETASRGVIYEQWPQGPVAQRLARELTAMLSEMRQETRVYDGEAAITLRAIEAGARQMRGTDSPGDSSYLSLMGRLLQVNQAARASAEGTGRKPVSSIVLP